MQAAKGCDERRGKVSMPGRLERRLGRHLPVLARLLQVRVQIRLRLLTRDLLGRLELGLVLASGFV
jgi:hypothetical protein